MGYGDLSCYGQNILSTPIIDQMASEGIRFYNHYTGSPVCGPSRASLMTGKHTGHTTVRGNAPAQLLDDNEVTLAKVMKRAGYTTGLIGKWGIGHPIPVDDAQKKGFDYSYGYLNMWHAHNFYPEFMYENGKKVALKNKLLLVDGKNPWAKYPEGTGVAEVREEYAQDLFNEKALNFITENKATPFFLYLAFNVPHANNEATPDGMEVPTHGLFENNDWPVQEKGFASMIKNIDESVGMVLAKLKALGLDENTVVMFASDNGPHQEGGHTVDFFNSNGDLRGRKRDLFDGGVKTPFIVRWPGKIKAGAESYHLSAFWDVMPTLAELAGVELNAGETDGISFLPTLLGNETAQKQHKYLYWEFYESGGKQSVIKGEWKLIKRNVRDHSKPIELELYNLSSDPQEKNNVVAQNPEVVEELEKYLTEGHSPFAITTLFEDDGKNIQYPFPLD